MKLQGKAAIITGSTSGIGLGIARSLAKEGASIMLNGLGDSGEIKSLQKSLALEFGVPVHFHLANMAKTAEISEMVRDTVEAFGKIDILVNNAGIQFVAPLEEFPPEKWDDILSINLSSSFHCIRNALPLMKAQNWGRIINVASVHGLVASPGKAAYVAAKHGLVGLTKVVALETASSGITCNAICPGWVLTPLVQRQIDELARNENLSEAEARERLLQEKQPSKEFVTTEQIGETAAFLCSPAAAQIRGALINLDGGWLAQ